MPYHFQKAISKKDFKEITDLYIKFFVGGREYVPEFTGVWWILKDGKKSIGFCAIDRSNNYLNTAYLYRAGIDFSYRGKGLHKRMIRLRERWAKKNGIKWVVTDTYSDNFNSSNSLISLGYRLWSPPVNCQWAQYKNALYWKKCLT